eukprot:GCRY01004561.1.p1 GENE.GCRY01004561.1~~GCRY01004561.1.p1  ORF type:complete len:209 (+),score=44.53 GCRY01004561.1:110-736(+)
MQKSQIVEKKTAYEHKFLRQVLIQYRDHNGEKREWESCERMTRKGDIDGVDIIATGFVPQAAEEADQKKEKQVILVHQFRPPVGAVVIEFPAGLIDEGESAAEAAVREMKEETGYTGQITKLSTPVTMECGMSNANAIMVSMAIDFSAPANQTAHTQTDFDPGEFVVTHVVSFKNLRAHLHEHISLGAVVDSRVEAFVQGLELAGLCC